VLREHRGVAVDVKNKKGNTPLWLACNGKFGYIHVVFVLSALFLCQLELSTDDDHVCSVAVMGTLPEQ